ncbi:MAG: phosphopyruvate hydratase [Bryobacter sp.]
MSKTTITALDATEILDSRGRPTLEVFLRTSDGKEVSAQVPSGASTGQSEAHELRDGEHIVNAGQAGKLRHAGKGVQQACAHVRGELAQAVLGMDVTEQGAIDHALCAADATPNKARLGANAILGISCAVARAGALVRGQALWEYLAGKRRAVLPLPMVNILSGGLHAREGMEFQDFLAIPHGAESFAQAMEWICDLHRATAAELSAGGVGLSGVADEGGWGPRLATNEAALEVLTRATERAGLRPGEDIAFALDVAASHFYRDGLYHLSSEGRACDAGEFIALLTRLARRFPIVSIEDGLEQNAWTDWPALTAALGGTCQIIGDDFLTTNPLRLERAIGERAANAVLVKMNQIGTLTETFTVVDRAAASGWRAVISARSGETEDSFLADLAVASGMAQIKVGSITRSERLAKYNRLLRLEQTAVAGGMMAPWQSAPERLAPSPSAISN